MADKREFKYSDETKHFNTQCKVMVYPWQEILNDPDISDEDLAKASRLDVSSQITNVTFTKSMSSAAGAFTFELTNSPNYGTNDWKDIIKRGYWCLIYMTQEGDLSIPQEVNTKRPSKSESKRIRCIGYIERVAVKSTTLENKAIEITYQVSGRDFGIVYEETNIWHNLFAFDKIMLDSIAQTAMNVTGNVRINSVMKTIHDLFYFPTNIPGAKTNDDKSLLSIGLQWLLPKEMLVDVGFSLSSLNRGTYWGALPGVCDTPDVGGAIYPTGAGIAVEQPGDYLSGNAWEQLKRLSVPPFHELFCEIMEDGLPKLIFRPIPWGIDQSKYPKNSQNIKLYKDLGPAVVVPAIDLYEFDMGEDDHSRYNSFLATVSTTLINVENNISLLDGKDYPKNNKASIRRHGFRPMHVTVDSIVKNEELGNGTADQIQLVEFNEILFDYWNNAVFGESGSVSKAGSNDIRIGKILKFKNDVPYLSTKRYYIEGYTDTISVDEKRTTTWVQEIQVTRGMEEQDLVAKKGFANRNVPFSGSGDFVKGNSGTES